MIIPILFAVIGCYAWYNRVNIFPTFIVGAQKGLQTAAGILPTMIGMLTAVYMLRASGCIDILSHMLLPILNRIGIPKECAALMLLKPISGGGGLALGSEIIKQAGPDSNAGRIAAVMLGASETSLYTISIYSGHLGLQNTRYAIPAALMGDIVAFVSAAVFVNLFMA